MGVRNGIVAGTITLLMMMMTMVFMLVMMTEFQTGSLNVVTHSDRNTKVFSSLVLYYPFTGAWLESGKDENTYCKDYKESRIEVCMYYQEERIHKT